MAKVKPWVKYAGVLAGVGAVVGGLSAMGGNGSDGGGSSAGSIFNSFGDNTITIGTNTYAGFLPFMYLNNGVDPNEDCIIYNDYGLKLKIVVQDDFAAGRAAFKNGDIDMIYCTADAFPVDAA